MSIKIQLVLRIINQPTIQFKGKKWLELGKRIIFVKKL